MGESRQFTRINNMAYVCLIERPKLFYSPHFQLFSIEQCTIFLQSTTPNVEIFSVDKFSRFTLFIHICAREIEIKRATRVSAGRILFPTRISTCTILGYGHMQSPNCVSNPRSQYSKQRKRAGGPASGLPYNAGFKGGSLGMSE